MPEAIDDARENAARNGVKNAEFFCGDASDVAKKLARENLRPDVITVDPPRKGLAADVVESIAEMQPGRVVYVSCDSATMARDVKRFADLGYTAEARLRSGHVPKGRSCRDGSSFIMSRR